MFVHLVDDPLRMLSMILIASVMIQTFVVFTLWGEMDWAGALVVLAGGLCTLPIGLALLLGVTGRPAVPLLGAVLVAYFVWMLRRPHATRRVDRPRWADIVVGAAGGITGGFAGFPAGPLVAWCGVGRVAARGVVQPFILMMQVAALLMLYAFAPAQVAVAAFDPTLLLVAAPALSGTICGLRVCGRLSDRVFARVVNFTLPGAGLAMLA